MDEKYRPVFEGVGERERAAPAWYSLPHRSREDVLGVTRPRVVKWYCPFADQRTIPSGHRYGVNVYTGCGHRCQYCHATGYVARRPSCKERFREDLARDLDALDAYDVPQGPLSVPVDVSDASKMRFEASAGATSGAKTWATNAAVGIRLTAHPCEVLRPDKSD